MVAALGVVADLNTLDDVGGARFAHNRTGNKSGRVVSEQLGERPPGWQVHRRRGPLTRGPGPLWGVLTIGIVAGGPPLLGCLPAAQQAPRGSPGPIQATCRRVQLFNETAAVPPGDVARPLLYLRRHQISG